LNQNTNCSAEEKDLPTATNLRRAILVCFAGSALLFPLGLGDLIDVVTAKGQPLTATTLGVLQSSCGARDIGKAFVWGAGKVQQS
jgi:hypothetical protein